MFDGNFRSTREVNLAGGRNRRRQRQNQGGGGTNTKQDLLKNAEIQRKRRQEQLRREKSARLIQRVTRGHQQRIHVITNLISATLPCLYDSEENNIKKTPETAAKIAASRAVSMCLSLQSLLVSVSLSTTTTPKQLLLEYSDHILNVGDDTFTSSFSTATTDTLWFTYRRLVIESFKILKPTETDDMERTSLMLIIQSFLPKLDISTDIPLFLALTYCFQDWYHSQEEQQRQSEITNKLYQWSVGAVTNMTTIESSPSSSGSTQDLCKAFLASILLSVPPSTNNNTSYGLDTATWFLPLVEILQSVGIGGMNNKDGASGPNRLIIQAIWNNLHKNGNDQKILSNMLDNLKSQDSSSSDYDPRPIIELVHYVLRLNSHNNNENESGTNELALLVTLMAGGDKTFLDGSKQDSSGWGDEGSSNMDDEDDDDDEEDDDGDNDQQKMQESSTTATTTKKARASYSHNRPRYTRKDLLTMLKLDKMYQDQLQQSKKELVLQMSIMKTTASTTMALADKIVKQAPWLEWGLLILDDDGGYDRDESMTDVSLSSMPTQRRKLQQSYIDILACLAQGMTSLRPKMKLNIWSQMAFSQPFMEKLWMYYKQTKAMMALAIFCDLFALYLVAVSDVTFVQRHTTISTDTSSGTPSAITNTSIIAEDVIIQLRAILYELYWSKPVMASEVMNTTSERGRTLLSGTKVWNSLYERWNRLLRRPFCDESAWWFPHLASREGDGAVFPVGGSNQQQDQDDNDDNDDDDDDSMDVDEEDGRGSNADGGEMSAADAETDALADTFRDPKMARILTCIPQALPFDRRVKLFSSLLKADKRKALNNAINDRALARMSRRDDVDMFFGNVREQVQIRRAALYQDSMEQLNSMGSRLKHQIQVSFINQHGAEEAGIDGGGVFKEFLDDLIKDGFAIQNDDRDSSAGGNGGAPPLFAVTPLQTLAVNFDYSQDGMLAHYEFLGRVLGKAMYESILVEPQFCLPFLNQLLAKKNSTEDLKNYDDEYYKNLIKLREMNESEIDSTGLTFELTLSRGSHQRYSRPRTVELEPGGRSKAVTKQNVFQYVYKVADQLLNIQGARQTKAFLRGFRDLIPTSWARLFSANELQKLISGDDSVRGIDVQSLKQSMQYLGGYHISQPYIQEFWDILETEFTPEQQRKFLRFMTSCSRQPLLGFTSLDPIPSIQQIRLGDDELSKNSKLPTSQTCMNLLKLPNYKNRQLLKEKLLAAIESGAGFELT